MRLDLFKVHVDPRIQKRAETRADVVDEYADLIARGIELPPVVVFFDGTIYLLADGFHRVEAAHRAQALDIEADIRGGTREDAELFAAASNQSHGLRRTNEDKRRAVESVLRLRPEWSNRKIAEWCGVSDVLVGRVRTANGLQSDTRIGRDGRVIETTNIGRIAVETTDLEPIADESPVPPLEGDGEDFECEIEDDEEGEPLDGDERFRVRDPSAMRWSECPPSGITADGREYDAVDDADPPAADAVVLADPTGHKGYTTPHRLGDLVQAHGGQVFSSPDEILAAAREIRAERAAANAAHREQVKANRPPPPEGKYRCIVIDPPWEMAKIERDERPNQVGFDYPTMSEDELAAMALPADDACHLYLWTTHKHLPAALRLCERWGFKYQCLMTWRKNVGFTPFSWMYSTEHVLFCTRGGLRLERMGLRLDFEAAVREHSRKPDNFYDLVREASPGPRIDMFSREARNGFDQWGAETAHFEEAS